MLVRPFQVALTGLITAATIGCSDASTPVTAPSAPAFARIHATPTFTPQNSGTTERLQAISPVSDQVIWASGTGGTFTLTTDGGQTWHAGVVPGAELLEFRDVEGVSDRVAYLMSAGLGDRNRIFRTHDGGQTWNELYRAKNPGAFHDCFAFFSPTRALLFADAINGRFPVLKMTDGRHWNPIADRLPPAQPGEVGFAASGTCITTVGADRAWIGTGGAAEARILATTDGGKTWNAYPTPIIQGTSTSGITTVDFRDRLHGILGGGELLDQTNLLDNVAVTSDGGKTWTSAAGAPFPGSIYGLTYVSGLTTTVIITGPKGAAWSEDEGATWNLIPGAADYWAVASASPGASWLVGVGGTILKAEF
jgi:photosystem II stability/assembly factor-like uncharacterized protein